MRTSRTLAAAALILVSVSWGATASAAPQAKKEPAEHRSSSPHLMSSCGNMDGI